MRKITWKDYLEIIGISDAEYGKGNKEILKRRYWVE